jgi:hypothetical protein
MDTVWGELVPAPVTVSTAVFAAALVGRKVMVIVQFAPTARLVEQALELAVKSLSPVSAIPLMASAPEDAELARVTVRFVLLPIV